MITNSKFRIQELDRRTLSWWRNRRERIDMDPPYQRKGRRWSRSDKQYLIDSIINGFDVPKFYVSDFTWGPSELNVNASAYAVIDGKQRFEAIFDFFDGKLTTSKEFKYIADEAVDAGGLDINQLRSRYPYIAEDFENFNPIVMGVVTSEKRFIEELFVRLNRSRPLTGAEVRNAMPGPIPELLRSISAHEFFTSNSKFRTGSGQDLNLAAKILMFEHNGCIDATMKENLDRFTENTPNDAKSINKSYIEVMKNLDLMSEIFIFEDELLISEGPIPSYYWLIREAETEELWGIRDFINIFSKLLKFPYPSSRVELDENLVNDLIKYKDELRSVNHKTSHQNRFEILKKWLSIWTKTPFVFTYRDDGSNLLNNLF
jgi:hypothetical protein